MTRGAMSASSAHHVNQRIFSRRFYVLNCIRHGERCLPGPTLIPSPTSEARKSSSILENGSESKQACSNFLLLLSCRNQGLNLNTNSSLTRVS